MPPRSPASPSPVSLSRWPVSIPAGILTAICVRFLIWPVPLHEVQGLGMVWPWLLGPFLTAYIRVHGGAAEACERAHQLLQGLAEHLGEAGIGQISEIFEGEPPHRPCGCFAQAWSVAEILRTYVEDVQNIHPSFAPNESIGLNHKPVPVTVSA